MAVAERKWSARAFWPRGGTLALTALTLATPAWAQLPDYHLELQVRTNLLGNASGAYNVGPGNLLAGSFQIPLTDDGQIALRLQITPEGREAVWWGRDGTGQRIYMLPDLGEDARLSDPSLRSDTDISSGGNLVFAVTGASPANQNGIYRMFVARPNDVSILRNLMDASNWGSLQLNKNNVIAFRASYGGGGQSHVLWGSDWGSIPVRNSIADSSSPYSFLYSPRLNDMNQLAGVVDLATASTEFFQELHIFNPESYPPHIVARTRGLDANSPVYRFASVQPAFNNQEQVAFLGTARDASGRNVTTLWLWDGTALRVLAQDGVGEIRQLEFFPPDMNDRGLVVFRAIDAANLRAVWVSDGQVLKRVVTEHDIVTSDLGPARIDQETPSNPVFAGAPSINARSDVALAAGLAPPDNDQEEWGTAVFIARATFPQVDGGTGEPDGGPGEPDAGVDGGPGPDLDGGPSEEDAGVDGGPGPIVDGGVGEDPDAGTGTDPDAGSGEDPDAGPGTDPDAGPGEEPGADGGPGEEPQADAGADAGQGPPQDAGTSPLPPTDSGCGCQSSSPSAALPWMLVGLMRAVIGRRRKTE